MFCVVGGKAIRSQQDSHIALIRINGSSTNTSMGVHASQDNLFRSQIAENLLQIGLEESTVAFLDYNSVLLVACQIWVYLGSLCALNHDRYPTVPYEQGSIAEVGTKQLLNPNNRAA